MNKLGIAILLLCLSSCHAIKNTRIWLHNDTKSPLRVEGVMLLPGMQADFSYGKKTGISVFRWCPTSSSPFKQARQLPGSVACPSS